MTTASLGVPTLVLLPFPSMIQSLCVWRVGGVSIYFCDTTPPLQSVRILRSRTIEDTQCTADDDGELHNYLF